MTRGRLRLTATARAALPNILPDLISAQLGSISHGLTISSALPQHRSPDTTVAPTSPVQSSHRNNTSNFSSAFLNAGKQHAQQRNWAVLGSCTGDGDGWLWTGIGKVHLTFWVRGKRARLRGEARSIPPARGSVSLHRPVLKPRRSPGSPVLLLCVTWMNHVQLPHPLRGKSILLHGPQRVTLCTHGCRCSKSFSSSFLEGWQCTPWFQHPSGPPANTRR